MHSIREYRDSDDDDDPSELLGGPPTVSTQVSLSTQMAATSVSTTSKPLTDAEIDAALLDYEDDSGGGNVEANATSKTVTACGKHSDCLHSNPC